jgi:hypothetical protein
MIILVRSFKKKTDPYPRLHGDKITSHRRDHVAGLVLCGHARVFSLSSGRKDYRWPTFRRYKPIYVVVTVLFVYN